MPDVDPKLMQAFRWWLAMRPGLVKPNGLDAEIRVPLEDVRTEFGADTERLLRAHASEVQELEPGSVTVLGIAIRHWTDQYAWSPPPIP